MCSGRAPQRENEEQTCALRALSLGSHEDGCVAIPCLCDVELGLAEERQRRGPALGAVSALVGQALADIKRDGR